MSNRTFLHSIAAVVFAATMTDTVLLSSGCSFTLKVSSHETVTEVVDGDTLDVSNGETVRLIGIDAPEAGTVEGDRATARLTELTLGKKVRLSRAEQDKDRYGRELRYVEVNGEDVGLELLEEGLAVARYDSRDGYPRHPREEAYRATSQAVLPVNQSCATLGRTVGRGDPEYSSRLDGDGDGIACEEFG